MTCRKCGRPLRDPESMARGLGPVCRAHRESLMQMSLFDEPREGEGESHGHKDSQEHPDRQVRGEGPPAPRFSMVAEDLEQRPSCVVDGSAVVVVDFDAIRGRRAPWWRRLWTWVRMVCHG